MIINFIKMKLILVSIGAVLGEQCYEVVVIFAAIISSEIQSILNEARSIERGHSTNFAEALFSFGACCEHDVYLDTENFLFHNEDVFSMRAAPPEGCIKSFFERCFACIPVQEDHPFCREDHPNWNPIACAIKLNQCLIESLTGLGDDCQIIILIKKLAKNDNSLCFELGLFILL